MRSSGDSYKRTFLVEAYTRSKSTTTAINAMRYIVEYGTLCDLAGRELTVEEYSEQVGASLAQAYRRRAAYGTCFGKQEVLDLWAIVRPILVASSFKNAHPKSQAIFASTIVGNWNVP
jgi:hypothetical protein